MKKDIPNFEERFAKLERCSHDHASFFAQDALSKKGDWQQGTIRELPVEEVVKIILRHLDLELLLVPEKEQPKNSDVHLVCRNAAHKD